MLFETHTELKDISPNLDKIVESRGLKSYLLTHDFFVMLSFIMFDLTFSHSGLANEMIFNFNYLT